MADDTRGKSSRHSKIAGDFGEALVLYWLSRYGYECARVDHTGIDIIARDPNAPHVMGISVKCRDRSVAREKDAIKAFPTDDFERVRRACEFFNCVPYYAIVVHAGRVILCFLLPLEHFLRIAGGTIGSERSWRMNDNDIAKYKADPLIRRFELQTVFCSWRELQASAIEEPR